MTEDLKIAFTVYGPCHVKIKQDKKKGLPGAFVQFEVSQTIFPYALQNPDIFTPESGTCQCSSGPQ